MPHDAPDISALNGVVSEEVLAAMRAAHEALQRAGIPHVLVGALAVGAYGYPRASRDVDFLVGEEAFDHHPSGIISLKPGVPIEYRGVAIDAISIPRGADHLREALKSPVMSGGIPIASSGAIAFLKLTSPRRKDSADIVELVQSGLRTQPIVDYLRNHAPQLVEPFEGLVREAERS